MFCLKTKKVSGSQSFGHEPDLVNKMFKYKTLGELVAMARATGERPVPTRNGVYVGEEVIPREIFDKLNAQRRLMDSFDVAQAELDKIAADEKAAAEERKSADAIAKAIADYKASLKDSGKTE